MNTATTRELYLLVNAAYTKIVDEAERPDPCIRRVVGQANFLDRLTMELEHRGAGAGDGDGDGASSPVSDAGSEADPFGPGPGPQKGG